MIRGFEIMAFGFGAWKGICFFRVMDFKAAAASGTGAAFYVTA